MNDGILDSNPGSSSRRTERHFVRRKRFQQGSLQVRSHGKRKMWVVLYRENGVRRYHTLGAYSSMSKSDAQREQTAFMTNVNARQSLPSDLPRTFGGFAEQVALPFLRGKWKASTKSTTEGRIVHHFAEIWNLPLEAITLQRLQELLNRKATTLSRSVVAHLRWDLSAMFKLAMAEGCVQRNPAAALYIPREAIEEPKPVLTNEEVEKYLKVFPTREKLIVQLALLAGMRPGEILALKRKHVSGDGRAVDVEQRIYRGIVDTPKTRTSLRTVAVGSATASLLVQWMEFVGQDEDAWVFASENPSMPLWRDNVWYRTMKPKLDEVGLGWATFQVLRRTHASLGHDLGIDPKVAADQRGHGIGVSLNVYTKTALTKRLEAAEDLEKGVLRA